MISGQEKTLVASIFSFVIGCELYAIAGVYMTEIQLVALLVSSFISLLSLSILGVSFTSYLKRRMVGMHSLEHALISATFLGGIHFGCFLWLTYELINREILTPIYAIITAQLLPCFFILLFTIVITY